MSFLFYVQFAEKRKELTSEDTDDVDAASDLSVSSIVPASGSTPKTAPILSSLTSELESVRGAITGAQDSAAQTGQFLVYLMRQMDQQRMHLFTTRSTRLALDLVDESQEEKRRLVAQQAGRQTTAPMFAMPTLPTFTAPTHRRRAQPSAAAGSAEQQQQFKQQQIHQDYQLATNIAAAAPPAHITPQMSYFTHLQPPNVQPMFMQQSVGSSTDAIVTSTNTPSLIRRSMDVISTPYSSVNLSQETFEANLDALHDMS